MLEKTKRYITMLAAFGTVFFWASAFPGVKYCLNYYSPEAIMLFRFFVATLVLHLACFIKRIPSPAKQDLPLFITGGFIGIFAYMWAFNTGTNMVTSGISSFIIAAAPVFTLILSIIFLKEKAALFTWVGVGISFIGLVIIGSTQVTEVSLNFGVILLTCAAVFTSIYNIIQRRILAKYNAVQAAAYCALFATIFMCIFFPKLVKEFPAAPISANIIIVYLGIFPAALSYFLWSFALSKAEKTIQITSFLYLSPFLTVIMSFFWLGEIIPPLALIGGTVIICGMVITNIKIPRKEK